MTDLVSGEDAVEPHDAWENPTSAIAFRVAPESLYQARLRVDGEVIDGGVMSSQIAALGDATRALMWRYKALRENEDDGCPGCGEKCDCTTWT